MAAAVRLVGRGLRDARGRTTVFACLFFAMACAQPLAYRHSYPTVADRLAFAHTFAGNRAIVLFYGHAYDLLTVGGYSAWRVGGTLAIFAAVFGVLAAVRALRAEEDAGRTELVLAGIVSRRAAFLAAVVAILAQVAILWLAELAGLAIGGLAIGQSGLLALQAASVAVVFTGLGAVAAQFAADQRLTLQLGGTAVVIGVALRVVADTVAGAGWARWTTPLGWAEELRPFAGARPAALLPALGATCVLLAAAAWLGARRDLGTGILPARDRARPRPWSLSSPARHALRLELPALGAWSVATAAFALIIGVISHSVATAGIPARLRHALSQVGSSSIATGRGYLSFAFLAFVAVVSFFAVSQVVAAAREESSGRLETMLSLSVGRRRWLAERLWLAVAIAVLISLLAAVCAWLGATVAGVSVSLPGMLEAAVNCIAVGVLFLGIAACVFALAPRLAAVLGHALVAAAFVWQLVGTLLGVPRWLTDLTPFAHLGLAPGSPLRVDAALVMLAIGIAASVAAVAVFDRRDLRRG